MYWLHTDDRLQDLQKAVTDAEDALKSVVFEDDKRSQAFEKELKQELQKAQKNLKEYLKELEIQEALELSFEALDNFTKPENTSKNDVVTGVAKQEKILRKIVHEDVTGVDLDIDADIVDADIVDPQEYAPKRILCAGCGNSVLEKDYHSLVECCVNCINGCLN